MLLLAATILAYLFNPLYKRLLKKTNKQGLAAGLTLVCAILIVVIPLSLIVFLSVRQADQLIHSLSSHFGRYRNFDELSNQVLNNINELLARRGIDAQISQGTFHNFVSTGIKGVTSGVLSTSKSLLRGIFGYFTSAIIFIIAFVSIQRYQDKMIDGLKTLSPLGPNITSAYLERAGLMTKGMVQGQFLIAICQGFIDAVLIYLGGIHVGFFFFFMLLSILSVIPVGGGIIALPVGVIMILRGNVVGGLIVIIGHLVIVTNIDNFLRPALVPKEVRLPSILVLLSVFAGIAMFGFLGIVIGPVIMVLITTLNQTYLALKKLPTKETAEVQQ